MQHQRQHLAGRVALVTGAGQGMGGGRLTPIVAARS